MNTDTLNAYCTSYLQYDVHIFECLYLYIQLYVCRPLGGVRARMHSDVFPPSVRGKTFKIVRRDGGRRASRRRG